MEITQKNTQQNVQIEKSNNKMLSLLLMVGLPFLFCAIAFLMMSVSVVKKQNQEMEQQIKEMSEKYSSMNKYFGSINNDLKMTQKLNEEMALSLSESVYKIAKAQENSAMIQFQQQLNIQKQEAFMKRIEGDFKNFRIPVKNMVKDEVKNYFLHMENLKLYTIQ